MLIRYCLVAVVSLITLQNTAAQEIKDEKLDIDWSAAKAAADADLRDDRSGIEKFRAAAPQNLDNVGVPVLVTGTGPVRAAPRLKTQEDSYAAIYPLDNEATLSIMGTGRGVTLTGDNVLPPETPNYETGQFTILDDDAEDGNPSKTTEADYSFVKFGAAYTLRLSCTKENDERCLKSDFAESVAKSLVQVGGSEQ